jgi:hypothetical protein
MRTRSKFERSGSEFESNISAEVEMARDAIPEEEEHAP